MDRLAGLEAFVAVAECGSLSRAATRLGKSPSALTKTITALEDTLGMKLLTRTTRQVTLTPAGRVYLETASEVLMKLSAATRLAAEADGMPRGVLKLTAPVSYGRTVLGGFCPAFIARHPEVSLSVSLCDRFVDIQAEDFDLALRLGRQDLPDHIVREVADNRVWVCASPDYLARAGTPVSPDELKSHACLVFRHPQLNPAWSFVSAGDSVRVVPQGPIESDNFNLLLDAALAGLGILPCPAWSVTGHIREGRLVPLFTPYLFSGESFGQDYVYAVYPKSRRASPKVSAFIDELMLWSAEQFPPLDPACWG
ncbi:LysR family transcriptional regulator [Crenobacter cavernae]|uniref:LysR family transcriptional regulator n=1 Tax=Crenobacter cavernae TaxID=2290923 RepID=A0A345Y9B3_9NEIS|nr:LysR family transcriptional regulator [Crenobacter cavernae]AXK40515.1 LysR family transcriptional regulator [Crenobacter cavernae]